jgi:hypothetical protein
VRPCVKSAGQRQDRNAHMLLLSQIPAGSSKPVLGSGISRLLQWGAAAFFTYSRFCARPLGPSPYGESGDARRRTSGEEEGETRPTGNHHSLAAPRPTQSSEPATTLVPHTWPSAIP